MADGLLIPSKRKACGGQLNDVNAKCCPHCGRLLDEIQEAINRKSEATEACPNCGSSIVFNIEKQQFECEHFKSTFSTQKKFDDNYQIYQADKIIPFQVEQERAKMHFYEWLTMDQDIQIDSANIALKQIYLPFSIVTINYECIWGAETCYSTNQDDAVEKWS